MAPMRAAPDLPLTPECTHYTSLKQLPGQLRKYFHQRHRLFSLYDDGVALTQDAWFGVTPEPVAARIADDLLLHSPDTTAAVVDLFAGAGGNAIAFALAGHWARVIAVEKDPSTLACAQNNARVYGVEDGLITWVLGDSFEYLRRLRGDNGNNSEGEGLAEELRVDVDRTVLFSSPPWGGPGYLSDTIFDLDRMEPYNLADLRDAYAGMAHALYLPRTSDIRQLAKLAPPAGGARIDVVHYCIMGASKALVAYYPAVRDGGSIAKKIEEEKEDVDSSSSDDSSDIDSDDSSSDEDSDDSSSNDEDRKTKQTRPAKRQRVETIETRLPTASTTTLKSTISTPIPGQQQQQQHASTASIPTSTPTLSAAPSTSTATITAAPVPTTMRRKSRPHFTLGSLLAQINQPAAPTLTPTTLGSEPMPTPPAVFSEPTSTPTTLPPALSAPGNRKRKRDDDSFSEHSSDSSSDPSDSYSDSDARNDHVPPSLRPMSRSAKRNRRRRRMRLARADNSVPDPSTAAASSSAVVTPVVKSR